MTQKRRLDQREERVCAHGREHIVNTVNDKSPSLGCDHIQNTGGWLHTQLYEQTWKFRWHEPNPRKTNGQRKMEN